MSTSKFEIERIVRKHPTELKYLFKSPTEDKRRLTKIISHLVPYRVGLEFECFGCLTQHLAPLKINSKNQKPNEELRRIYVRNKLRMFDFKEDNSSWCDSMEESGNLNEIRLSFLGYKGLIPLFNSLELMNKYCSIPAEKGGIHIHINYSSDGNHKKFALDWFNKKSVISEVLNIFGGYIGKYNKPGASYGKGHYIRVSSLNTIEFRIARLTYDYATIINWIIKCSELVTRCLMLAKTSPPNEIAKTDKPADTYILVQDDTSVTYSRIDRAITNYQLYNIPMTTSTDVGTPSQFISSGVAY